MGDLKEILAIVRRRRWLVLLFAAGGAGIAGYFAYTAKPVYLASASVRIADSRNAISGGIADAPRDNIGSSYTVDPVLSQIQVLKSREVAAEAVRRQPLGPHSLSGRILGSRHRERECGQYAAAQHRAHARFRIEELHGYRRGA